MSRDGEPRAGAVSGRRPRLLPWSLAGVVALLAVWQLAATRLPSIILPGVDQVAAALVALLSEPRTWLALAQSLGSFALGILVAAAVGTLIGVLGGLSARCGAALAPLVGLLNSVPSVAWMGLAMIWFGLGMGPTVFLVVVMTAPILATALTAAVRERDPRLRELAEVYGLSPRAELQHVVIPPILGSAGAALASMAGLGWKLTVMGEYLTASRGLGEMLVEAKAHVQTDRVLAITALLVVAWAGVAAILRFASRGSRTARTGRAAAHPDPAGAPSPSPHAHEPAPVPDPLPDPAPEPADAPAPPAPRDGQPLIVCSEVRIAYGGRTVAEQLSLELCQGRVLAVLGASGIGKSSLLQVLGGLLEPSGGTLERAAGSRVSYVFQEDRLLPWRSAEENVTLLTGASAGSAHAELEALGLRGEGDRFPDQLSGGMRRRVALARGFLRRADALLLDEPFSGLDPVRRSALVADLDKRRRTLGQAVVFVTHDVDDAILMADEAIVLGGSPARIVARVDLAPLSRPRSLSAAAASRARSALLAALLTEHAPDRGTPDVTGVSPAGQH